MSASFWRAALAIVGKDIRAEFRTRELLGTMAVFSLLCLLVFSFALELNRIAHEEAVSGVLWVTLIFASMLGFNRSLTQESDHGTLEAMLLSPVPRSAIFAGKLLGNAIFTGIVAACILPLMTALFDHNMLQPGLILTCAVGLAGVSAIGTMTSLLTIHTRTREALLPIAMLPLALPLLLTATRATAGILNHVEPQGWLLLLCAISLMYLTLCGLLARFALEE